MQNNEEDEIREEDVNGIKDGEGDGYEKKDVRVKEDTFTCVR